MRETWASSPLSLSLFSLLSNVRFFCVWDFHVGGHSDTYLWNVGGAGRGGWERKKRPQTKVGQGGVVCLSLLVDVVIFLFFSQFLGF